MWPFQHTLTIRTLPKLPPLPKGTQYPPSERITLPKLPSVEEPALPQEPQFPVMPVPQPPADMSLPQSLLPDVQPTEQAPLPSAMPLDSITLWLSNGVIVRDIGELAEAVSAMSDATFHYHVNVERNDMASWIQDVVGDKELAMKLATNHKRTDFLAVLKEHLDAMPKRRTFTGDSKRFAYLGLRGMASTLDSEQESRKLEQPIAAPQISAKKKYVPAAGIQPTQKALRSLDSMQEAEDLVARLAPRGTMLAEMLKQKRSTRPAKQLLIAAPAHEELLPAPRQVAPNELLPTPLSLKEPLPALRPHAPKMSTEIPKLSIKAPRKSKGEQESEKQTLLINTLEDAKQKAEQNDAVTAKQLLAQAKSIIKLHFHGNSKPYQYHLWDVENSLRRALLGSG